jgi:hypothetical protein
MRRLWPTRACYTIENKITADLNVHFQTILLPSQLFQELVHNSHFTLSVLLFEQGSRLTKLARFKNISNTRLHKENVKLLRCTMFYRGKDCYGRTDNIYQSMNEGKIT